MALIASPLFGTVGESVNVLGRKVCKLYSMPAGAFAFAFVVSNRSKHTLLRSQGSSDQHQRLNSLPQSHSTQMRQLLVPLTTGSWDITMLTFCQDAETAEDDGLLCSSEYQPLPYIARHRDQEGCR